jgi:predicted amidohydrolase YtcJ
MTHLYTVLVGGTIIPGRGQPDAAAIAWAEGIVIALGSDDAVRAVSRGDSDLLDLQGAIVIPLAPGSDAGWPVSVTLEVGGPADLAILSRDPREAEAEPSVDLEADVLALIRGGRLVQGTLPSGSAHAGGDDHRLSHSRDPR